MKDLDETLAILRTIWPIIAPYQDDVMVVGGAAAHLYTLVDGFAGLGLLRPLGTVDLDIGVPTPLATRGGKHLVRLLHDAGFHAVQRTTGSGATRIDLPGLGSDGVDPYLEFLAPAEAGFAADDTVQDGIQAHVSPFAWMLFVEPLRVPLPDGLGLVRLPHPLSYAAQKTLIAHTTRPLDKRSKDFADALHVLSGFRSSWSSVFAQHRILEQVQPHGAEQMGQAIDIWTSQFGVVRGIAPGAALVGQRLAGGDRERMPLLRDLAHSVGREILAAWRAGAGTSGPQPRSG